MVFINVKEIFRPLIIIGFYLFLIQEGYCWNSSNFYEEVSSPVRNSKARTAAIIGTSVLATSLIFKSSIVDPFQDKITESNKLGNFNRPIEMMGQLIPNALYTLGMLGHSYFSKKDSGNKSMESAEVMIKATAYAGLVTTILKYIIREKRPTGNQRNSFPSGHTTTAFAFASVIAERHKWYFGVPAYMLASLVGFQRINYNRHYIHDVIAGATIGIAFGIGVNKLIKKSSKNLKIGVIPYGSKKIVINLKYNF